MCAHSRVDHSPSVEHVSIYTRVKLSFSLLLFDIHYCLHRMFEAKALRRVDRSIDRSYHFIDYLFDGRLMSF